MTEGATQPGRRRVGAPRLRRLFPRLPPLTFALGIALTIGATVLLLQDDRRAADDRARQESLGLAHAIELAVTDHLAALRGLAAHAAIADGLGEGALARYTALVEFDGVLPALHGLEWVPADDGQIDVVIAASVGPSTTASTETIVDLVWSEGRQTTVARALASDGPALSAPAPRIPADATSPAAVVVYEPVETADGRLLGVAGVALDLDALLDSLPVDADRFALVDVATGVTLLGSGDPNSSATTIDLRLLGRRWALQAVSDTGPAVPLDVLLMAMAGLVASAFLAMIVSLLERWGELAEQRAAVLTHDLRRTFADLETATSRLREGMRSANVLLWERKIAAGRSRDRGDWWQRSDTDELPGFYERVHPDDRDVFDVPLDGLEVGSGQEVEFRLRNDDGDYRWTVSRGVVIERGGERLVLGANIDVDDKRRALEQVRHLNQRLEESNQSLREFTRVASHDLRAPLRAVRTLAGFLRNDLEAELGRPPSRDLAVHLERIEDRVERLDRLLDDLLVYARADYRHDIAVETDIAELVDDVLATAESRGALRIECDLEVPLVLVSPTPLSTCVRNLVDNAIKFHDRPDDGTIVVRARAEDGVLELAVIDDGPGIDRLDEQAVWEPFRRLGRRGPEADEAPGSGIGLNVIRRIAEAHDATVSLDSTPGLGATFTLRWPAPVASLSLRGPAPDRRAPTR